jgi:methylated-DNA-[protein]-cysteine S-methyltransferase
MLEENYSLIKCDYGVIKVLWTKKGIKEIILPKRKGNKNKLLVRKQSPKIIKLLEKQINEYFKGKRKNFSIPLDLDGKTEFQKKVYKTILKIPYGKVCSYKEIAKKIHSSPRAVGQALKRNSLPIIIPCHRIISSDTTYCGFSQGLFWKERLLRIEKVYL